MKISNLNFKLNTNGNVDANLEASEILEVKLLNSIDKNQKVVICNEYGTNLKITSDPKYISNFDEFSMLSKEQILELADTWIRIFNERFNQMYEYSYNPENQGKYNIEVKNENTIFQGVNVYSTKLVLETNKEEKIQVGPIIMVPEDYLDVYQYIWANIVDIIRNIPTKTEKEKTEILIKTSDLGFWDIEEAKNKVTSHHFSSIMYNWVQCEIEIEKQKIK